ncbi:FAD:protein FMN transferase [Caldimonas brevitalea]|uniref:FAD:protein FMN transferase n=1 Tax=Caldimonas brevitalea TaxID=413882 RepID=A0A0G3BMZ2_9BURK|nr:FAD:protein FMN transferase [Caldimonas brevitalea]AKJ30809.1 thiamine biosynthesis protein ApbE [Caldimonas brevitalea]
MDTRSHLPVNRRRRSLMAALPLLVCGLGLGDARAERSVLRDSRLLMGTRVDISVAAANPALARRAINLAWTEMGRLVDMMSHFSATSVVAAINLAAGVQAVQVPAELMRVLKMAQQESVRSRGAFDITVGSIRGWSFDPHQPGMPSGEAVARQLPLVDFRRVVLDEQAGTAFLTQRGMRIDLGGIAKLPILEAGIETLKRNGIASAMINGGGDVAVGGPLEERPWRIGVRDPRAPQRLLGVLPVTEGFVVSSGDYERFFMRHGQRLHHILNPGTGRPTEGLRGVTLVARDLESVNGVGASLMVAGAAAARQRVRREAGLEGLWVKADGTLSMSPGLAHRWVGA